MKVGTITPVRELILQYPECETVLKWHGIRLTRARESLTVAGVCFIAQANAQQVLRDLQAAVQAMDDGLWTQELADHLFEHSRRHQQVDEPWRDTRTYGGLNELHSRP